MRRGARVLVGLAAGVVIVLGGGAATVAAAFPSTAAAACPSCYGFADVGGRVHVEAGGSGDAEVARIRDAVDDGRARVAAAFGGLRSSPVVLACVTDACFRRVDRGGATGPADGAVVLGPRDLDAVGVASRLVPVELRARLAGGHARAQGRPVPPWFDEGLAVLVAGGPGPLAAEASYVAGRSVALPATGPSWAVAATRNPDTRARAAGAVERWLAPRGGLAALPAVVERMADGQDLPGVDAQ